VLSARKKRCIVQFILLHAENTFNSTSVRCKTGADMQQKQSALAYLCQLKIYLYDMSKKYKISGKGVLEIIQTEKKIN
jgi:hypothetical protein